MSKRGYDNSGNSRGLVLNDARLVAALHDELISPLVLLRQLSLAASSSNISEGDKDITLSRLTLTTERAMRIASSVRSALSDQQELPLEAINPANVCLDVLQQLRPLMVEKGVGVEYKARSKPVLMIANRSGLENVLEGMIDNALEYTSEDFPMKISVNNYADRVRISVRDHGPAVPSNLWESIETGLTSMAASPVATRPLMSVVSLVAIKRIADKMNGKLGIVRHSDGVTFYFDSAVSGQTSLL